MSSTSPPRTLAERIADRLTGGRLTELEDTNALLAGTVASYRRRLDSRPDGQARIVLGAVLARLEVREHVPDLLLAHWDQRHAELSGGEDPGAQIDPYATFAERKAAA